MLFNLFKKNKIQTAEEQLSEFLRMLKACDSGELGLPVGLAAHFRNMYALTGRDLNKPGELAIRDPEFLQVLILEVQRLQAEELQHVVPGLIIWVHSIRAAHDLRMRDLGRQMWGQLARGFPFAESASRGAEPLIGFPLDIDGFDQFPELLSPTPR
jgi:hypothetical protein